MTGPDESIDETTNDGPADAESADTEPADEGALSASGSPAGADRDRTAVEDGSASAGGSIDSLVARFAGLFARDGEPDLDEIRKRTTIRDVVDYREIQEELDPGWSVYPEIVQFGEEPLADALIFDHYERTYDVILKPVDTFEPTENVELYVFDRQSGTRRRIGRVLATLEDALQRAVVELTHEEYDPDAPYLAPVSWRLPEEPPDVDLMTIEPADEE